MTTKVNKKKFSVEIEGKPTEFCVVRPDAKLSSKAQLFKARTIRENASEGALLREEVEKLLRDRKIWDEEKEQLYNTLAKSIKEDEAKLAVSKKQKLKMREAADIAFRIAANFTTLQTLTTERNSLDHMTAEGMAQSCEFDYLLAHSIRHADGKQYYVSGYEEMTEKEECPVYDKGKEAFLDLLYGPYEEQLKKRPEWKWLLEHKFVNDQLRLIDKDGNLVDGVGRRVDAKGRLISPEGAFINEAGEPVDEYGFLVASDEGYYTDEDGAPLDGNGEPVAPKPDDELPGQPVVDGISNTIDTVVT